MLGRLSRTTPHRNGQGLEDGGHRFCNFLWVGFFHPRGQFIRRFFYKGDDVVAPRACVLGRLHRNRTQIFRRQ